MEIEATTGDAAMKGGEAAMNRNERHDLERSHNVQSVLLVGKKGAGKTTACKQAAKPRSDLLNGWRTDMRSAGKLSLELVVCHTHQRDECTVQEVEKHQLVVGWVCTADEDGLEQLEPLMQVMHTIHFARPVHQRLTKMVLVICRKAATEDEVLDDVAILTWCKAFEEWCEFTQIRVELWQQELLTSTDHLMPKLFHTAQGFQQDLQLRTEFKEVFGLIDTDGGGSIDSDEFYELMCIVGMGDQMTREEAHQMLDQVDADGSGEIEFEEFLQVMTAKSGHVNSKKEIQQAFEFLTLGSAAQGLPCGDVRVDKLTAWLELFRPKDAKISAEECVSIICCAEKEPVQLNGKTTRVINFNDFVEIQS